MDGFFLFELNYDAAALFARLFIVIALLPFGIKKFQTRKDPPAEFPRALGLSSKYSFYLAMFAETFAPFCLFWGFFTRIAALGGMLNMGVAYWVDTKEPSFKSTPFYYATALPILLGYVIVFLLGPGKISLDYLMF